MDAVTAAAATADVIGPLPAGFMLDAATYERGAELGFDGTDFYVAGRGGVLGDVEGAAVSAAFVFFNPAMIDEAWNRSGNVMGRLESAAEFDSCLARWADRHLPDDVDYERLADLAARIARASTSAGAPLFAAWASAPEPSGAKALALHRLNVLRELRGARHGAAVVAAGVAPLQAVLVNTPFMAPIFGWPEPYEDVSALRPVLDAVEKATNESVAPGFEALSEAERDEFSALAHGVQAGATRGAGLL